MYTYMNGPFLSMFDGFPVGSCRYIYIYHPPIEMFGVEFVKHKKILQNNGLPTEEETFGIH